MWSSLMIAVEFFVCGIPLHILICRLTSSYKFISKTLVVGVFVLLFLAGYQHQSSAVDLVSLFMFSTIWFAYMMFLIGVVKSHQLKMLDSLAKNPNGELHLNEFARFFQQDAGLRSRLISMKMNGFIDIRSEKLCLTQRARHTLSFVDFLRRIFLLDFSKEE